jgi:hypothetical protein
MHQRKMSRILWPLCSVVLIFSASVADRGPALHSWLVINDNPIDIDGNGELVLYFTETIIFYCSRDQNKNETNTEYNYVEDRKSIDSYDHDHDTSEHDRLSSFKWKMNQDVFYFDQDFIQFIYDESYERNLSSLNVSCLLEIGETRFSHIFPSVRLGK